MRINNPGTAQVGAISKAQKAQSFKNCSSLIVPKNAEDGTFIENFGRKSHNAEKAKTKPSELSIKRKKKFFKLWYPKVAPFGNTRDCCLVR